MQARKLLWLAGACLCATTMAAEIPAPGAHDPRVRYVTYQKDEVTVIHVRRGAVTRIVLADDEKIAVAGTGFPSDCTKTELEWCVRADIGSNQIWAKPKDNATHNNLELKTDKRDYSVEFKVLPDVEPGNPVGHRKASAVAVEPMFRVIFRYPVTLPPLSMITALNAANVQATEGNLLNERLVMAKPVPRNWNYSMQVMRGAEDIAPSLVFDDGRFTYFRFPANREVPTLYTIAPSGEETRINFHMEGDLAVVQRMGQRFVLRLGQSVVGVWNDAFDLNGVAPQDGTTIDGVVRTLRTSSTAP